MSTRHTGSRFARQLRKYSASNCKGRLEMLSNQLDSTRIERLVTVDVVLSYRKSIRKTLPKFSASDRERGCRFCPIDSIRTTRHIWCRPVIPDVDLQDDFTNDESSRPVWLESIRLYWVESTSGETDLFYLWRVVSTRSDRVDSSTFNASV